jgi:hypothetical protein
VTRQEAVWAAAFGAEYARLGAGEKSAESLAHLKVHCRRVADAAVRCLAAPPPEPVPAGTWPLREAEKV